MTNEEAIISQSGWKTAGGIRPRAKRARGYNPAKLKALGKEHGGLQADQQQTRIGKDLEI